EDELARLRSPIGLDLGARTPEETAVSIAAELIQIRWGGSGKPLSTTRGRIPRDTQEAGVTEDGVTDSAGRAVGRVVPAAGAGARLGTPKALLEFGGERLVDRGVRLLQEGGCHPVVVVLGAATVQVRGAVTVRNPDWRSGMGSSLRAGLAALPAEPRAVVIAL